MEIQTTSSSKSNQKPELRETNRSVSTKSLVRKSIFNFDSTIEDIQKSAQIVRVSSFSNKSKVKSILKNNPSQQNRIHIKEVDHHESKGIGKKEKIAFNLPEKAYKQHTDKDFKDEITNCKCSCILF